MAHVVEKRNAYTVLVGKLKKGDHMKEPGVGRNIFLKMSLNDTSRIGCCGHELDIS